jgi:hypothetical protein
MEIEEVVYGTRDKQVMNNSLLKIHLEVNI